MPATRFNSLVDVKFAFESFKKFIPVDCSWHMKSTGRDAFTEFVEKARLPGARFFDIDQVSDKSSAYPHMLPSQQDFEKHMSKLSSSASLLLACMPEQI
jgi:3-mercaptopyruvate sulfurtransferase SseA